MKLVFCTIVSLVVLGVGVRTDEDLTQDLLSESEEQSYDSTKENWFGLLPRQKCRNKKKTAGFVRRSCDKSWNKAGRCKWISGDGCMTNCKSRYNQKSALCDRNDCVWEDGKCDFANSTLSARQDYCGRVTKILSDDKRTFCDGVTLAPAGTELLPMNK